MKPRRSDLIREIAVLRRRAAGFRLLWEDAAHLHALVLGLAEAMAAGEPGAVEAYREHFPK